MQRPWGRSLSDGPEERHRGLVVRGGGQGEPLEMRSVRFGISGATSWASAWHLA